MLQLTRELRPEREIEQRAERAEAHLSLITYYLLLITYYLSSGSESELCCSYVAAHSGVRAEGERAESRARGSAHIAYYSLLNTYHLSLITYYLSLFAYQAGVGARACGRRGGVKGHVCVKSHVCVKGTCVKERAGAGA